MRKLLVLLAACGSPPHPAPAPPVETPHAFLQMLVPDRVFDVPIVEASGRQDGQQQWVADKIEQTTLHCRVTDVDREAGYPTGQIACTPSRDDLFGGIWTVREAGLFRDGKLLIAAAPDLRAHRTSDDTPDNTEVDNVEETYAHAGGWCTHATSGDELARDDETHCYDATGPTSGQHVVIDGPEETWRELRYGSPPHNAYSPLRTVLHEP